MNWKNVLFCVICLAIITSFLWGPFVLVRIERPVEIPDGQEVCNRLVHALDPTHGKCYCQADTNKCYARLSGRVLYLDCSQGYCSPGR